MKRPAPEETTEADERAEKPADLAPGERLEWKRYRVDHPQFKGLTEAEIARKQGGFALGDFVRMGRLTKRLTIKMLAKEAMCSPGWICTLESGAAIPTFEMMHKICMILGLNPFQGRKHVEEELERRNKRADNGRRKGRSMAVAARREHGASQRILTLRFLLERLIKTLTPARVEDVAHALDTVYTTARAHLGKLEAAGLVELATKEQTARTYLVTPAGLAVATEDGWRPSSAQMHPLCPYLFDLVAEQDAVRRALQMRNAEQEERDKKRFDRDLSKGKNGLLTKDGLATGRPTFYAADDDGYAAQINTIADALAPPPVKEPTPIFSARDLRPNGPLAVPALIPAPPERPLGAPPPATLPGYALPPGVVPPPLPPEFLPRADPLDDPLSEFPGKAR